MFHHRVEFANLKARASDDFRFWFNWLTKPMLTGAISPSGASLARKMASFVNPQRPGLVVELGPGTGVVTKALLERGVNPAKLAAIEYSPSFVQLLQRKMPQVHIIEGDAYALDATLEKHSALLRQSPAAVEGKLPINAIVSSLPLLTRPLAERKALLKKALAMLDHNGAFIQFSYGLKPPIPPSPADYRLQVTGWVLNNLPPARVWVYRPTIITKPLDASEV